MSRTPVLAYLNSTYARASDTFIRGEVAHLRALGFTVHTFSIRRPPASEVVSEAIRTERAQTGYVLVKENWARIAGAILREAIRQPGKLASAALLSLRCSGPGLGAKLKSVAYLAEACYLAQAMRAKGVEHLHNHFGEGSAVVAMLVGHLAGIPYSLTIHGPGEFDHPRTLAFGEKIRRSSFTVSVSDWGRSQLMRWIEPADCDKIEVVHCGVDDRFLAHSATPIGSESRFVFVGRLVTEKGLLTLIDAAGKLAAEGHDFKLVIIGDGPMRATVEERVARLGLTRSVEIKGWMSSEGVRSEIIRARAFVLPSYAENLPVALMEAGALGRPVITTYIGGIPELFRDGVHGWVVPASSTDALSAAMREALIAPRNRLDAMGAAAAEAVSARHNGRAEAMKLAGLFTTGPTGREGEVQPQRVKQWSTS